MSPAPTGAASTAAGLAGHGPGVRSSEAMSAARTLLETPVEARREILRGLTERDRRQVFVETLRETGSVYGQWHDTPSGFTEDVVGETLTLKQREVMDALADPVLKRIVVPAGFGVGKTTLAGRVVAWGGAVNPVGTIKIVTTATRMRQVRSQLWPHIKTAVSKAGLPGRTDTVQWVAPDQYGNDVQVAYGFSAAPNDEAAMQGIHGTPKLLLVVDEAGGIAPLIGNGTNNLLTGDAKLLAIGNPAMDDPGSWFEKLCEEGESAREPSTRTIRIAATDSPAITGEDTPVCMLCVPNLDGHTIAGGNPSHLPDWQWLARTLRDYGAITTRTVDLPTVMELRERVGLHPYLTAKVFARFPRDSGNKVIPTTWVDLAKQVEEPTGEDTVVLRDLGLDGEHEAWRVKRGSWVRLGVDVAAGGGDEFAIYRAVGDLITERHVSSGSENSDSVRVAEKVLEHVYAAERLALALGTEAQVRVKIDTIGVGWGVVGHLQRIAKLGKTTAAIVPVHVGEGLHPDRVDESAEMRPWRKRDEMWLTGRQYLQPDPSTGEGMLRLRVPTLTAAQLSNPNLGYNSGGFVKVESKDSMKSRGVDSPDRGEAALLSIYEPDPVGRRRRRGLIH